jgi:hypothetical protein
MYLIFTADTEKYLGSNAPAYTPEGTSSQNSLLLHVYVVECKPKLYLMDATAVILLPFMAVLHTHTVGCASWAKHFL